MKSRTEKSQIYLTCFSYLISFVFNLITVIFTLQVLIKLKKEKALCSNNIWKNVNAKYYSSSICEKKLIPVVLILLR